MQEHSQDAGIEPNQEQQHAGQRRPMEAYAHPQGPTRGDIGPGVIPLALLVILGCVFFLIWGNWTATGTGDVLSLSYISVAVFSLLLLLNRGIRKLIPRWRISRGNLLAAFSVAAICGGLMGNLWTWGGSIAQVIGYPIWTASYADRYAEFVVPYLPRWLIPTDRQALVGFFAGESNPYNYAVIMTWLPPVLWWTAWVSATLLVTLCLSVLVRRRWADEERLAFPIASLPLNLTDPDERLYRNRLFWIGLTVAAGIVVINTASSLFPAIPVIPTMIDFSSRVANNPPWDGLRCTNLRWSLGLFGLAYLMPLDMAFSLVIFNLFWRAVYLFSRAQGWINNAWEAGFPYGDQQVIGGYAAIVISVFWLDRRYIIQVLKKGLGLSAQLDDKGEALSYRAALIGLVLGVAFLWWWFIRCGIRGTIAGAILVWFFVMLIVIMRVRAQVGPPSHWMYGTMPEFIVTQYPGLRALGPRTLGMLAIMRPFMGEQNGNPAPIQLEAIYMSSRAGLNSRRMAAVLLVCVPVIMLVYFWASIHIGYKLGLESKANGELTGYAAAAYGKLDGWLQSDGGPNWNAIGAIGVGAAITLMLMYLKLTYPLWPLHPIAFPMGMSYAIDYMLPPILLTWLAKLVLLRYGGLRAHRSAVPFFFGLLIGDFSMRIVCIVLLQFLGIPTRDI